jgi:hypothetical protein
MGVLVFRLTFYTQELIGWAIMEDPGQSAL